jgi:ribonuclease R
MNKKNAQPKLQGTINANPRGFGFATTDDGAEYFVPPPVMKTLLPGDRATFAIGEGKKPGEFQVAQVFSVEREPSIWLGELEARNGRIMLVTDDPCFVGIEVTGISYIAPGQVVAVQTGHENTIGTLIRGRLVGILGPRGRQGFDHDYALAREDLKVYYDPHALSAAAKVGTTVDSEEKIQRFNYADLRDLPLVTIDGESTRDFDDAVAAEKLADHFLVDVAIADVSAYVTPNSPLDREAQERCTSVYLPGMTVPMLPEALSTGLCSLNPGVDRLALVCRAKVSLEGKLLGWKFMRAVIRSQARLTYSQVYQRMSGEASTPLGGPAVEKSLDALDALYRVLVDARRQRGVMEFNDKEPRLQTRLDGGYDLVWEERNDAHRLVEELMLLANQAAAAELTKRKKGAGYFRHQQAPQAEDWAELREWLAARGVAMGETPSLKEMAVTLEAVKDREDSPVIEARMRKVMQMAVYDTLDASHFSLGYEAYTHFTSPIRRYSDLLVHRILNNEMVTDEQRKLMAERCSNKSRSSRFAERFVWDRLKKRILVRDVSTEQAMPARVVTSSRRGLKVVFDDWQCAAFIPAESLLDAGMTWDDDSKGWQNGVLMEPGRTLQARWQRLEEDKSRCELTATVA